MHEEEHKTPDNPTGGIPPAPAWAGGVASPCHSEEASKIDNLNPALADVVFDSKEHSDENSDDDDSDIEIIDMPVANKKPRVLQEILKELQEDPYS